MRHPTVPLASHQTPLHPLPRLSEAWGAELWIKRDDLTGFGLSGNKVRKLEYLVAAALEEGADTLITTGGTQSNHCRATAVAARQHGLDVHLVLRGQRPEHTAEGNLLLNQLLGATVHWLSPEVSNTDRDAEMQHLATLLRHEGKRPYVIPEGGSNGLGAMGYVRAAQEAMTQFTLPMQGVVSAIGSGGTLAGMAMGFQGAPKAYGVAVCDDAAYFRDRVQAIGAATHALGGPLLAPAGTTWDVLDGFQGPGYAQATPEIWATIAEMAHLEGIFVDPAYTGKALHALKTKLLQGEWSGRWLFWHTGGGFGLFGRGEEVPGSVLP